MAEEKVKRQTDLIREVIRSDAVYSPKDGQSTVRIARYLTPCADQANEAAGIPNSPLLSEIFPHSLQKWPSKVLLKGWYHPQRRWKEWVERLAQKYGALWNQTGICDAIMSSMYEVRGSSPELVLGLCEFWCPETNTFVFPWGEATITLEDVMILGGYPVLGEPITSPLTEELVHIEQAMEKKRIEMVRGRAKKASHGLWLNRFMEKEEGSDEFEHVGFLSLWLSRFVFPSPAKEIIRKHVFPIAIHLSKGKPMALASAVLSSIYRDLSLMKEQAMASKKTIVVSAPFQLLQLWAFEHFPLLGPNSPNILEPGEPRVARWQKLTLNLNLPLVRSAIQIGENFKWRPYTTDLENWRHLLQYQETEQFLCNGSSLDGELQSFFRCLRASELVGIGEDCKEKYVPYRVAMQFGMDQDLPGDPSGLSFTGEHADFFVPPRSFQPGVSGKYVDWWKDMMLARGFAVKDVLVQRGYVKISKSSLSCQETWNEESFPGSVVSRDPTDHMALPQQASAKSNSEGKHTSAAPGFPSKDKRQTVRDRSDDDDDAVLSTHTHCANVSSHPEVKPEMTTNGHKKLRQVPPKSNSSKENHESATLNILSTINKQAPCESSDDDNVTISTFFKLPHADFDSAAGSHQAPPCNKQQHIPSVNTSAHENSKKRKAANGGAKEVEGKASKSTELSNGVASKVKKKVGRSVYEPIDINIKELTDVTQKHKGSRKLAKCVAQEGKRTKAGQSIHDPIDMDNYVDLTTSRFKKDGRELEGRVEKLEKLLGLNPDY